MTGALAGGAPDRRRRSGGEPRRLAGHQEHGFVRLLVLDAERCDRRACSEEPSREGALSFPHAAPTIALSPAVCRAADRALASSIVTLSIILLALLGTYLGQAWNILMGYCGLLSLGHAALSRLGAYASAILFVNYGVGPWLSCLCRHGAGGRRRGSSSAGSASVSASRASVFSLLTIAFAEIVRIGFDNWSRRRAAGFLSAGQRFAVASMVEPAAGRSSTISRSFMAAACCVIAAVLRFSRSSATPFSRSAKTRRRARALGVDINPRAVPRACSSRRR